MKTRSVQKIIEEQARKWQLMSQERKRKKIPLEPMIYVSRQPGSRGHLVAKRVAELLKFNFFDREVIMKVAESSQMRSTIVETLDERGRSMLLDWIQEWSHGEKASFDDYLEALIRVIGTITRHGRAVIVGRGAGYILPKAPSFRVRIIAPLEKRIAQYAEEYQLPEKEAKKEIARIEAEQRNFIMRYFDKDISEPLNYHLLINLGEMQIEEAAQAIKSGYDAFWQRIQKQY